MRLAVLTTGRQDWGILRSTALMVRDDPRFDLKLFVGGMHCSDRFGRTEELIAREGFEPAERLDWIAPTASTVGQAGEAVELVGDALRRQRPDALLLVGDRFETVAAALAATIERVPIVHVHGGEETIGAFDDALRHAVTKLSHLHLVSHEDYRARVIALGESTQFVHVVGAPGLDNMHRSDIPTRGQLESELGVSLQAPVVLVTLHPTTLARDPASTNEVTSVIEAMERVPATYVITLPNNDPGSDAIREALSAATGDQRVVVEALGDRRFWGLLRLADAMLGNSSSGLIEAPALGLPAVNVGERQEGRLRPDNVIDVPDPRRDLIEAALREALAPATRERLAGMASPFGDGRSAARIVEILAGWTPPIPPRKASVPVPRRAA